MTSTREEVVSRSTQVRTASCTAHEYDSNWSPRRILYEKAEDYCLRSITPIEIPGQAGRLGYCIILYRIVLYGFVLFYIVAQCFAVFKICRIVSSRASPG